MPTISSMLRGTYLMYKYNNVNVSSNKTSNTMSGLIGIRSNVKELINNYNTTKQTFNAELSDTLDALKKSTSNVKNLDFKVGADALNVNETVNEDGSKTTTMSDKLSEVVKGIKDFADKYNDTIKFFTDNAETSKRVKNLSSTFADTTYNAKSAASIGIKVGSDGKMTVDENELAKNIAENPTKVGAVMSTLTNKADRHISFANVQKNNLFPTMNTMLGGSLKSASVYNGNSLLRLSKYSATGSLLNYFV